MKAKMPMCLVESKAKLLLPMGLVESKAELPMPMGKPKPNPFHLTPR